MDLNYSFSLPLILSNLNINVGNDDSNLVQLSYGVFLISLVALICFIKIIGYIIVYFLIQSSNYEIKYPRFSKYINRYKKVSLIYFAIEVLLCLICLLLLVFFSLLYIYSNINNI